MLGTHEHKWPFSPSKIPTKEFQLWTNQNDFFHIPTVGGSFTWSNGRLDSAHTLKRLDRAIAIWTGWTDVYKPLAYLCLRSRMTIILFSCGLVFLIENLLLLLLIFSRCRLHILLVWRLSKPLGILMFLVSPCLCFVRSSRP